MSYRLEEQIESIINLARNDDKKTGIYRPDDWYAGQILLRIKERIGNIFKESLLADLKDGDDGKITEYEETIRADFRRRLWDKMEEEILK